VNVVAAVSIADAAHSLGVSGRTVQRWLERGAPFVLVRGRRHVDVDELRRWQQSAGLRAIASAIRWAIFGDAGGGRPAWRELALPEAEVLALLLLVYTRAAEDLGEDPRGFPAELRQLESRLLLLRRRPQSR
jgi:hypothetical protein